VQALRGSRAGRWRSPGKSDGRFRSQGSRTGRVYLAHRPGESGLEGAHHRRGPAGGAVAWRLGQGSLGGSPRPAYHC